MSIDYLGLGKAAAEAAIDAHGGDLPDPAIAYQFLRDSAADGELMVVGVAQGVPFSGDELDIPAWELLPQADRDAFLKGYGRCKLMANFEVRIYGGPFAHEVDDEIARAAFRRAIAVLEANDQYRVVVTEV